MFQQAHYQITHNAESTVNYIVQTTVMIVRGAQSAEKYAPTLI